MLRSIKQHRWCKGVEHSARLTEGEGSSRDVAAILTWTRAVAHASPHAQSSLLVPGKDQFCANVGAADAPACAEVGK